MNTARPKTLSGARRATRRGPLPSSAAVNRVTSPPGEGVGRLFQETLKRRPFWMLVACVLVNRTTWAEAKSVHRDLMRGGIAALAFADRDRLERGIRHLGLSHAKTLNLIALAQKWEADRLGRKKLNRFDVMLLPGCGVYAADSWSILIEGRGDIVPTDKKLKAYLGREARRAS